MTMFYLASIGAWYHESTHTTIPADAIGVDNDTYVSLLAQHAQGRPYSIVGGAVVTVERPAPTDDELAAIMRAKRNELLVIADRVINTAEDVGKDASAWRKLRVSLRDLPTISGWPRVAFPATPADQLLSAKDLLAIEAIVDLD